KLIQTNFTDANGISHTVKYETLPDYLAIGSDSNFCRIPMGPVAAQKIADLFGAVMPTRKLVDNIYQNCEVKLAPVTYAPVGNQNELIPKFIEHNTAIEQQRIAAGGQLGQLTGGTKKDVVLSNLIIDPARLNHVVIYGWHQLNGQPIQPLTNIHINTYVDYSHGIRLLNNDLLIDNQVKKVKDILKDAILYKVLSDETGVMTQPTYVPVATVPNKPASFGVKTESNTKLRVIIKADSTVQSYRVYTSKNGTTFNSPLSFTANNFVIDNLPQDSICFIKITAGNVNGYSAESEVLAGVPSNYTPKIIIVNGFDRASTGNTYNFIRQHGISILKNGYAFESATNDAVIDNTFSLNHYQMADYILGDESTADETLNSTEQNLIKLFLRQGGKLFLSGSELAWDLDFKGSTTDKDFIWNYLKVQYIADAPNGTAGVYYNVTPAANTIFTGISPFNFDNGTQGTIDVKYPDVVKGISGGKGVLLYTGFDTSYGYAGVSFEGMAPSGSSNCKVISLGFPFETIYPEAKRIEIMSKILQFFEVTTNVNDRNTGYVPDDFNLYQNYPNPFNATTEIEYSLKAQGLTTLKIYDVLGREVKTIFSGFNNSGEHKINFDAGNLASGTYIYKLTSAGLSLSKKMLLLK
ncbi:MAG: T9SS type A sorting domain-containing protein, partial [Bacteroidota bacterium]|nr:T9SS type A sorting domain-containing protein [Bacteroidota bacterium]